MLGYVQVISGVVVLMRRTLDTILLSYVRLMLAVVRRDVFLGSLVLVLDHIVVARTRLVGDVAYQVLNFERLLASSFIDYKTSLCWVEHRGNPVTVVISTHRSVYV